MFQPSKETVLNRWAFNLGPQPTVTQMLSHLGDKATYMPFDPGEEPMWLECLAVLMSHNPQFTVDEVVAELSRRTPIVRPFSIKRR